MEAITQEDFKFESTELNKNVFYFCGSILHYYHDVLNEKELFICRNLINGQSLNDVAQSVRLTSERVRQIFRDSIKKISDAFQETMTEMTALKDKNEELTFRNFALENEMRSAQRVENVESLMNIEMNLGQKAKELLTTPIENLPLPVRAINTLRSAGISTFREIPLLTRERLLGTNKCGMKTYCDIRDFLAVFSLQLGLSLNEVIVKLSLLLDKDIPSYSYRRFR